MLPPRAKMDLAAMAMKGYPSFLKVPRVEPYIR